MSLAIRTGMMLGAYEILEPLGAGGMGEVYKARDTRLGRLAAIKVLPAHLAFDTDSRERFEREARAVSQLNHPHICTLYDIGSEPDPAAPDGRTTYLVMEYLQGETLEARLAKGVLPLDQALRIAIDVADALDTAHSHGVVHRDLKPGNVMLTKSGATLLDFGLAKLQAPPPAISGFTAMPTGLASTPLTGQGTILGTLQYMAPEQLEGLEADARTDIFAFGALLYELVTGRKAFQGKSQPSLISAIMSTDPPPVSAVQTTSPPALDHLVKVCLAKDPADRWRSAHDVLAQLKWIAAGGSQVGIPAPVMPRRSRARMLTAALVAAAMVIIALAVPAALYFRPVAPPPEVRFEIHTNGAANPVPLAVSPDGRRVAYLDRSATGVVAVFIRALDSPTTYQIAGSEGASNPFWSPDGREIGFSVGRSLMRAPLAGGTPQVITSEGSPTNAAWSSDGTILFSAAGQLRAVPASGGSIRKVADLDGPAVALSFFPGSRDFLFTAPQAREPGIYAGSLDAPTPHLLLPVISNAMYAEPGLLLFVRQGTLYAQHLDRRSMTLSGEPTMIVSNVLVNATNGRSAFAVSQNGVLAYRVGGQTGLRQFVWSDRDGKMQAVGKPDLYSANFDLSPDGSQLALSKSSGSSLESDLYVMEWARDGATRRITFDKKVSGNGTDVVWSPDGTELAYTSTANDGHGQVIFRKASSGLGEAKALVPLPGNQFVEDWSKDGQYLAYVSTVDTGANNEIWVMPLFGDRKPFPVDQSSFLKDEPHFSPDGKWLAYNTAESGKSQIQVVSLPVKDRIVVTTDGGALPRWRADGRELFYLSLDSTLMSVDMTNPLKPGHPNKMFPTGMNFQPTVDQYAVHPDGKRFLLLQFPSGEVASPITVVVNWMRADK